MRHTDNPRGSSNLRLSRPRRHPAC